MDILLDTHVGVWWADDPRLLDEVALRSIEDGANTVWFSAASAWELAIKVQKGKLAVDVARLVDQLTRNGVRILGIGVDDGIMAGSLEWAHRDPFDRMLVGQAQRLRYTIATRDHAILAFVGASAISS